MLSPKATTKKNGHTWVTSVITIIFTHHSGRIAGTFATKRDIAKITKPKQMFAYRRAVIELMTLYEMKNLVLASLAQMDLCNFSVSASKQENISPESIYSKLWANHPT